MHVEIRELSLAGEDQLVGTLRLTDGKIVAEPADRELLAAILAEDVYNPESKRVLSATEAPEEWLQALPGQYRTAYLRAIFKEKDDDEERSDPESE